MKKLIGLAAAVAALAIGAAGCFSAPPPSGGGTRVALGDSEMALVAANLPVESVAVGGTTVCQTAGFLPDASEVVLSVGGHSWGLYNAAQAQACLLSIVDHYSGVPVYVATPPVPLAIYCGDAATTNAVLDYYGIPHNAAAITANPDYELRQRVADFATWETTTLRTLRPSVHVVDWRGDEHSGPPDCTHLTPTGVNQAAAQTWAAGF